MRSIAPNLRQTLVVEIHQKVSQIILPSPLILNGAIYFFFQVIIIVISRLVYRKGIDFLISLIPLVCKKHPKVEFFIVGDGPKRIAIEEMVEDNKLQNRVTLFGAVKHEQVRDILVQGHIFLNASLTEAFCMAIIEAASCGLQVVSTNVGGIPEVLPKEMIWLTEPTVQGLLMGIEKALADFKSGRVVDCNECHLRIKKYYKWEEIAIRTENVYKAVGEDVNTSMGDIFVKLWKRGSICDIFFMFVLTIEFFLVKLWNHLVPKEMIDDAPDLMRSFKIE